MSSPRRVLAYVRVSGQEQGRHGTSLDAQREAIERYCSFRSWPAPRIYVEVESAGEETIERRTELKRLLATAEAGDQIAVTVVDRWSRDLVFGVESVRRLVRRGIGWIAVNEGIDATTRHGDSHLGIMAWAADQERQRIKDRTVGRRKQLRDQGLYVEGLPPFGYRRERGGRLVVVPEDAQLVREIYRRCGAGESLVRIGEEMQTERPQRAWDKKSVHVILTTRVYIGEIRDSKGHWIKGAHDPIIDPEVFARAREGLAARRLGGRTPSPEARTATWLLRGIASCTLCGHRIGAAYGSGTHRGFYVCGRRLRGGCDGGYMRVDDVDSSVSALALERLTELRHELARPRDAGQSQRPEPRGVESRRRRLEAERARAITLATRGAIGEEDLRAQLARIDSALARIDALEAAAKRAATAPPPLEARRRVLADVEALRRAWSALAPAARREALVLLARSIHLDAGQMPAMDWRSVAELAEEGGHEEIVDEHLYGPTDATRPLAKSRRH